MFATEVDGMSSAPAGRIVVRIASGLLVVPAVFANFLTPHDPLRGVLGDRLTPPFWLEGGTTEYPLGTDSLVRSLPR